VEIQNVVKLKKLFQKSIDILYEICYNLKNIERSFIMKVFYWTKDFIENELGIKNITTSNSPVSIINGQPVAAKMFKWDSIEECKNSDIVKDTIALNGSICLYEYDTKSANKAYQIFSKEAIKEENEEFQYVDDFNKCDLIYARLFVVN
jgi:hypothetical protein